MTLPLITQYFRAPGINKKDLAKQFKLFKYPTRCTMSKKYEAHSNKWLDRNVKSYNKLCLNMKKGNANSLRRKLHYKANTAVC